MLLKQLDSPLESIHLQAISYCNKDHHSAICSMNFMRHMNCFKDHYSS